MSDKLLKDILITNRQFGGDQSNRHECDVVIQKGALRLTSGYDNLSQAILNRLFTRKGELKGLGHPDYGSRLHTLIGEPNSRRTRAFAELYIRECLEEESRIREIQQIVVKEQDRNSPYRDRLEITIAVLPVKDDEPIIVTMSMNLGG